MVQGPVDIIGRVDNRRAGKPDDLLAEVRVEHDYDPAVAVYTADDPNPLGLTPVEARRLAILLSQAADKADHGAAQRGER